MARARNIKPGFFKNEDLAECTPWARLCFAGLWTLADREGRLEDRPKRIKGELFAFDSIEVDPLLAELQAHGFLVRYRNSDGSFIQISRFSAHQTPHYSEKESAIKAPSLQELIEHDEPENPRGIQEESKSEALLKRGSQPPDSLIPDSLIPPKPPNGAVHRFPPGFEAFWSDYPKKVGKDAAAKAFAKRKFDSLTLGSVLHAVQAQKASAAWTKDGGQFIPNPATWLNEGRWQDEIGAGSGRSNLFEGNL